MDYQIFLYILIALGMFAFMEFVAWFTHKYVMHGFLWALHEDHHRKSGTLEKNDLFTIIFATPAIVFLMLGINQSNPWLISVGAGITLYGIGYFLFHDVMFHKRLKWLKIKAFSPYFKRIVHAHAVHHQSGGKDDSAVFGFLWASKKYDPK